MISTALLGKALTPENATPGNCKAPFRFSPLQTFRRDEVT